MFSYRTFKITKGEQKVIDGLFESLGGFPIDIFKPNNWETIYIESRPFIDEDSYSNFQSFYSSIKEIGLNVLNYPLYEGEEYLKIIGIPNYQSFIELMDEYYFSSTGGVAFGEKLNWALHSDADNSILFFGYEKQYAAQVKEIFSNNKYIISKERLIEMYAQHKYFLKGDFS